MESILEGGDIFSGGNGGPAIVDDVQAVGSSDPNTSTLPTAGGSSELKTDAYPSSLPAPGTSSPPNVPRPADGETSRPTNEGQPTATAAKAAAEAYLRRGSAKNQSEQAAAGIASRARALAAFRDRGNQERRGALVALLILHEAGLADASASPDVSPDVPAGAA